jgi:DNA-binding NarL/FixJ family response regulator
MAPVRVLIVDDDPDMRDLVRAVLELADGFEVVGEATDGSDGILQFLGLRPDVVVIDHRMPDMTGVSLVQLLQSGGEQPNVVFFSAHLSDATRAAMTSTGPCVIVEKDDYRSLPAELAGCIVVGPALDECLVTVEAMTTAIQRHA